MKKSKALFTMAFLPAAMIMAGQVLADGGPSQDEMWNMIMQQQKEIEALKARLNDTQKTVETKADKGAVASVEPAAKPASWTDKVTVGGHAEVEFSQADTYMDVDSGDIAQAKVEVFVDAQINEWVNSHIQFIFEDGATVVNLDEAIVTIGDTARFPVYAQGGYYAAPFGTYESMQITDPLTKSLGEAKEGLIELGAEKAGFKALVYAFNGDVELNNSENDVRNYGARIGYAWNNDDAAFQINLDYINSISDTDGMAGDVAGPLDDNLAGYAASAKLDYKGLSLMGEYIASAHDYLDTELEWRDKGASPSAWHGEVGYSFDILEKPTALALSYTGTSQAVGMTVGAYPESRYQATAAVEFLPQTTLAFEWMHDMDYDTGDYTTNSSTTGSGKSKDTATVQLAIDF